MEEIPINPEDPQAWKELAEHREEVPVVAHFVAQGLAQELQWEDDEFQTLLCWALAVQSGDPIARLSPNDEALNYAQLALKAQKDFDLALQEKATSELVAHIEKNLGQHATTEEVQAHRLARALFNEDPATKAQAWETLERVLETTEYAYVFNLGDTTLTVFKNRTNQFAPISKTPAPLLIEELARQLEDPIFEKTVMPTWR